MAKVICSQSVKKEGRRLLPVGCATAPATSHELPNQGRRDVSGAPGGSQTCPPPQPVDVEKLVAERDGALKRAEAAEEKLTKLCHGLSLEQEKAREAGYREGCEKAGEEVAAAHEAEIDALKKLVRSLSDEQEALIRMAEDAAVEIGFAAAVKIIGREGLERPLVAAMVQEAMRQVSERDGLRIHLSAEDCRRMEAIKEQCTNGHKWSRVEFKEDEKIELGGCIIHSRVGALDARLEHQLQELRRRLVEARRQNAESA